MKLLENNIRKSMKGLGFNIYIFPENQSMSEIYEKGFGEKTMPESYVNKLARSNIVTVNHLLPTLTQLVEWPERKRKVLLIGIRGEVPLTHGKPKKELIDPVAADELTIGYELGQSLGLKKNKTVIFMGQSFTITKIHTERGNKDDISIWMNLAQCQALMNKKDRINAILALECNCATVDRLGEIRLELGRILPGTKIIEHNSKALARAEARNVAKETAIQQLNTLKVNRATLKKNREGVTSLVVILVGIGGMLITGFLAFLNAKERLQEIGLFLAIGYSTKKIFSLFLGKAALSGFLGALLGIGLSLLSLQTKALSGDYALHQLISLPHVLALLFFMPIFSIASAWLPSFWTTQKDPSEVLRYD